MLLLDRKPGERIYIGNDIYIVVVKSRNGRTRVGIEAPRDIPIRRGELDPQKKDAA